MSISTLSGARSRSRSWSASASANGRRHRSAVVPGVLVVALSAVGMTAAANASVTNTWITWDAPASYNLTGTSNSPGSTSGSVNYAYAGGTTGVMTLPDLSTVYVRLTGEVVSPFAYGSDPDATSGYGGPSGFSQNGTTRSNFWSTYPDTDAATYSSPNVGTLPTNGDHIGLVGGTNGIQTQTIEFFSDAAMTNAASVQNIVLLVASLGFSSLQASWTFNQDFEILSDNSGVNGSPGLSKSAGGTPGTYVLSGREGAGAIQFTGSFTSFSWTVSASEAWSSWNIGATSAAAPSAVPGAGLAGLATLGLAGLVRRRRR